MASSLSLAPATAAPWDLTSVEDSRGVRASSARFDPAGMPAIAYGTHSLLYATFDGAGWSMEVVAPGCGGERGASLAFDPDGNPAISYVDDNSVLHIARRSGTAWLITTIDDFVRVSGATSLAFDPAGNPAVAYQDADADLRYTHFDGSVWTPTTVDAAGRVGEFASLGFAGGQPVISYHDGDNGDLKAARFDGSNWQTEVVDGTGSFDTGRWSSVAVDPGGAPGISYIERDVFGLGGDVKYAHYNAASSTWDIEYVTSAGGAAFTSLGFDDAGSPAVAYFLGGGSGVLRYDTRGPAGWTGTTVDSFEVGQFPSLAFDPAGNPGISYFDYDNYSIKFAHGNGAGFSLSQVDASGPGGGSIAFDAAGNAGLSFFDGPVGGLKFARFDGLDWADEPVERGFWIGSTSSLAFDAAGNPLIAYDDRSLGNLKLARWNGSSWVPEVVDAGAFDPTAPMAPSLALDPAGHPAISYRWVSGGAGFELKLARFDGSTWNREIAVPGLSFELDEGRALAFDSGGKPAIAFEDAGVIKLATRDALGWDVEVADPGASASPSLAFDGAGNPVIAYTGSAPTVEVARRTGTTWQREAIASGTTGTVAIDPSGHPAVGYVDGATFDLKVARWDGTMWGYESITPAFSAGTVAVAPSGGMAVVYESGEFCRAPEVALSITVIPAAVHRGVVPSLAPGWQTLALPLTSQNDDETPPFPIPVPVPGGVNVPAPPPVPLVLYRVLRTGSVNTGNSLRVVKGAGSGNTLSF